MKRQIENWKHYYTEASKRQDLRVFKDLLQVNMNQPHVDISNWKIITKDGERTFSQVIEELKPKENGDSDGL